MKKSLLHLISICGLCFLSACGGGGGGNPPPPATHFSVTTTAAPSAGAAFNIVVTALGASGQMATSYSGTVHFSSTDGQAVFPANALIANGTGTFLVTLKTVGSQTITATDTSGLIAGTSNSITVGASVATHFTITGPGNVTAGSAFSITVNALDASGDVVASYSGTVHFTSSDIHADLAHDSTLTMGTAAFPAALKALGGQMITATDTVTPSITGMSNSINVSAAAANPVPFINQPLSPDAIVPGGAAFKLTVNGTGFVSGAMVEWNGSARATNFVSESQLTANILLADIASFNTASVKVVNPAPGGGASNVAFFESTRPTSSVSWSVAPSLAAGTGPSSVATADFNEDGKLDVVVTNGGSSNISVFLGNGNGTFQPAVNYPAGTNPDSVAVGDFNGDGKLDLIVANHDSNNISILLGNGDGTFQAAVNYPAGTSPTSVAVGDFNGDGKLDLIVANHDSNNISILLGNGDGTFQAPLDFSVASAPHSVAVGDFNGDGKLDLAVANSGSGNVSILLGNGDGTFQSAVNYPAGPNPTSVAIGYFSADAKLDLAVANDHGVDIFLGNGDGTFQAAVACAAQIAMNSLAVGDFNGDGKLDLAATTFGNVSVLLGNGDGTFGPGVAYAAGSMPLSLAVGDFNGDGRLDMAIAGTAVSVLLQPGLTGPNATLAPTILTFPNQLVGTASPSQPVTLSNNGTASLNITSIAASINFSETDNCGSSLPAGTSCTINATFVPIDGGKLTGTLSITDNAPGSPQTVILNGVGTAVTLVPNNMSFTCIPFCQPREAILTNHGATPLTISSITITSNKGGINDHGGFAQTNNCPPTLAAGKSCSFKVTFIGQRFNFEYIGALIVQDSGGQQEVSLHGIAQ
jgi:VCBS repeat protein/ASPM-SPD-2-Hydin domain-containing protein/FG-GAP repeat protein